MSLRLALLLLTLSAALPAWAADEVRQAPSPDGCEVVGGDPTNPNVGTDGSGGGGHAREPAGGVTGSNPDGGARTPRWHSFLPGMFR